MVTPAGTRVVEHAICTFCGCVCDDIGLTVEGHRITKAKNACVLCKAWFLEHQLDDTRPEALVGRTYHIEPAYDAAILPELRKWFADFYTIEFENYPVEPEYLARPERVPTVPAA